MRPWVDTFFGRILSDAADTASRPEAPSVCPCLRWPSAGGSPYPRMDLGQPGRGKRFVPDRPASDAAIVLPA